MKALRRTLYYQYFYEPSYCSSPYSLDLLNRLSYTIA